MNNRVRELLIEAGFVAPELAGRANKLIELIVQECIDLAVKEEEKYSFSNSTPAKYFTAAISDFQGVLAKHFGVEE
jgi:hypothetical protein